MEERSLARILVVEDDQDIRDLLVFALSEVSSYEVHACARGDEAVDAALRFRPDLVLLDAMLPGMDGLSVLRALRQEPRTRDVAVVFLTARTQPSDLAEYRSAGAVGVIAKPFELNVLEREIARAWQEHRDHVAA